MRTVAGATVWAVKFNSRMGTVEAKGGCSTGRQEVAIVGKAMGTVEAKGIAVKKATTAVGIVSGATF